MSICDGRLPIFSVPPFAYINNSGTLLCLHGKILVLPLAMKKLHRGRQKKNGSPFDHPKKFWSPCDKSRRPFLPVNNDSSLNMLVPSQYFIIKTWASIYHSNRMLIDNMTVCEVMMIRCVTLEEYKIQNMYDHSSH